MTMWGSLSAKACFDFHTISDVRLVYDCITKWKNGMQHCTCVMHCESWLNYSGLLLACLTGEEPATRAMYYYELETVDCHCMNEWLNVVCVLWTWNYRLPRTNPWCGWSVLHAHVTLLSRGWAMYYILQTVINQRLNVACTHDVAQCPCCGQKLHCTCCLIRWASQCLHYTSPIWLHGGSVLQSADLSHYKWHSTLLNSAAKRTAGLNKSGVVTNNKTFSSTMLKEQVWIRSDCLQAFQLHNAKRTAGLSNTRLAIAIYAT